MEKFENHEQSPEYFKELVEEAKADALSAEKLEVDKDIHDRLIADFIQGKITRKEYESQEPNTRGAIELRSEHDLRLSLSILGIDNGTVEESASHERSHYHQAEGLGLIPVFMIQFSRRKDGKFSLCPSTNLSFPDNMTDDQIREALKKVIGAANDLSPRDQSQLEDH